jgi:hypothetical protein
MLQLPYASIADHTHWLCVALHATTIVNIIPSSHSINAIGTAPLLHATMTSAMKTSLNICLYSWFCQFIQP